MRDPYIEHIMKTLTRVVIKTQAKELEKRLEAIGITTKITIDIKNIDIEKGMAAMEADTKFSSNRIGFPPCKRDIRQKDFDELLRAFMSVVNKNNGEDD